MKRALLVLLLIAPSLFAQQTVPMLSEPALSPDSREIAFVSGGDIWTVPAAGGEARLLVSDPAMESRPLYSPDGRELAFVSTRTGNGDIYVIDLAAGVTRRITWDDGRDQLDGWSRDGKWLYFSSTSRDISSMNDVWRVSESGGTPMQVTADRYVNEYFAAPSPDGKSLAFVGRGMASSQWWRHGSAHIDQSELWLLRDGKYQQIVDGPSRHVWPMWSPDGARLYYVSDAGKNENLWTISPGEAATSAKQLTQFTSGRVLWPSMAYDGSAIVFERDFGIWRLDLGNGQAAPVRISLRGAPAAQPIDHRRLTDHFASLMLSPDGQKVAFTARGDVWAASAKDGGDAYRVTNTAALEQQVVWSPDSKSLVYVSDRGGRTHLYRFDLASEKETQLTAGDSGYEDTPRFSHDGKSLAYQHNRTELQVMDVATKQVRTVAKGLFDRPPFEDYRPFVWSPDDKWIAYIDYSKELLRNAFVVPASGETAPRAVSFLANTNADTISWSADGKFLLMATGQRSEQGQIARIDLVPITPKFREDQFRDLFRESPSEKPPADDQKNGKAAVSDDAKTAGGAKKAPPKVAIVFEGIRERAHILPIGLDAATVDVSPDGKWIAFTATVGDNENVYAYSIDELATDPAVPKQLTSTSGPKSVPQFSPDSKEVFFLDGGAIAAATLDPVKTRAVRVTAETDVDFAREKEEAFSQAWRYLRENFYDPAMHGADWDAIRVQFAPRVAAARTPDELRRLLQLMIGELNASHLGANPPASDAKTTTGRIGVRFDRGEYETNGRLRVSEVIPLSPADVSGIVVGDVIVAVDGTPAAKTTNLDSLLDYRIGKRTVITLDGATRRDVVVQPIRSGDERGLTYRAWVNANRAYVDRVSGGRLGYVHMYDMSSQSLEQLYLDLDAENRSREGVVVDIRNNNGGFVNVYAIDVLSRQPYLNMTLRDFPTTGARSLLGQRALEKPTILVTNRNSLSDAEDFSEGYRSLKLGKVVGEPTAGWIIYTANISLIDGTIFRIPFIKITDSRGEDMENNPRPVDVFAAKPVGEKGDSQLDVAVKELLAQLGTK